MNIVKPLQDKMALEYTRVLLDCTVSNPRCSIRWYKGRNVILPSGRFEICSEGCYRRLVIQEVTLDDAGMYSVQVGENTSSARLTVEGETKSMVKLHTHWEVWTFVHSICLKSQCCPLVVKDKVPKCAYMHSDPFKTQMKTNRRHLTVEYAHKNIIAVKSLSKPKNSFKWTETSSRWDPT